jgi:CAAX prenyl protease-like protein
MNVSKALRAARHPAVCRIAPFAIFMLFVALSIPIADGLSHYGFDPRWIYAARTTIVFLLLLAFWKRYSELRLSPLIEARDLIISVGAGVAVFAVWINLDFGWATLGDTAVFDPTRPDGSLDWILIAFRLFGLALVVPVMEELFWRSFLLRWIQEKEFLALDPQQIGLRANLVCAVLFASEHSLWLAGLLAGLVYNYLYVRTGKLWVPIISHATTNAVLGGWILATGNWQFW